MNEAQADVVRAQAYCLALAWLRDHLREAAGPPGAPGGRVAGRESPPVNTASRNGG